MLAPKCVPTDSHPISPEDTAQMPIGEIFDPPDPDLAVAALARELADVMETLDEVAGILGACASCFGLDQDCPHCQGNGSPGHRESTEPALQEYWKRALVRGVLRVRVGRD
jgi:hypothetical protein